MTEKEITIIVGAVYVAVEYWFGKTDKVKSGSVLESVFIGIKALFNAFKK